jgi:hypothetical protein
MTPNPDDAADPLYLSALREMKWILAAWVVNFAWVTGYCRWTAFRTDNQEEAATVLGMPSWVCFGVFIPWIAATVFTAWFALTRMEDHPLEDPTDE